MQATLRHRSNTPFTSPSVSSSNASEPLSNSSAPAIPESSINRFLFRFKAYLERKMKENSTKQGIFAILALLFVGISALAVAMEEQGERDDMFTKALYGGNLVDDPMMAAAYLRRMSPTSRLEKANHHDSFESFGGKGSEYASIEDTTIGQEIIGLMEKSLQDTHQHDGPSATEQRMLIHDGKLFLSCSHDQINSLAEDITNLIETEGKGYVQSRTLNRERWMNNRSVIEMQLRVTSSEFYNIMSTIRTMAGEENVTFLSVDSRDVTDEYIDSSSRADTIDASRNAIKMLLTKANTVQEVIEVQRELNRMTEEVESHRKRALYLKNRADLSTLHVRIEEKVQHSKPKGREIWWNPMKPMLLALAHMSSTGRFLGDTLIYFIIWAVPGFAIAYLLTIYRKK